MTSSSTATVDEKKEEFIASREKIRKKRLKAMEKRRQMRQKRNLSNRNQRQEADIFLKQFTQDFDSIEKRMMQLTKHQEFKQLKMETFALEEKLANNASLLQSYTFESKNRQLNHLKSRITKQQEEVYTHITHTLTIYLLNTRTQLKVAPKPKFKFSKKISSPTKNTNQKESIPKEMQNEDELLLNISQLESNEIRICNKTCETICMNTGIDGCDVFLSNLNACTISLVDVIGAIRISKIEHCTLITGPISSSFLAEHMSNCKIYSAMLQCRIHWSNNCTFYIHVNSEPVIEECNQLLFAPYIVKYPELDGHWMKSGLNRKVNLWDKVKDFKWFKQQQSPHWSILNESQRLKSICPVEEVDDDEEL